MKRSWLLFAAIFAGPIAWAISLQTNFALAPLACSHAAKSGLYLVLVFAFLLASAGEVLALSARRSTPAAPQHYDAMVWAGIGISAFSILLIVAQTIPTVFFAGCE
ncbi:MAG TPA: hypothetical protein VGM43_21830 [Bryobacteraceae bacterium]|jgi:uncharacterized membrane protein